ncbi:hypothetical protein SAMN05660772_01579 [Pasteurella testudinis DSM 23072]|uniref:Thiol:disulfide interchange protein DsbA n=1 Tax=Pasteurella testudinis DSM 23072 TaxID=1122938 RepID=A0A1W1VBA4_9PAST|nr:hypothetical protein [Pasteurella testudinis]SMB90638.1 hypothetical protein SAMN05660772_01579 [Pasteurella testudinis DSM 23072]SUB52851.1 thioredoxin fold protein [Pasteurella testudinis]
MKNKLGQLWLTGMLFSLFLPLVSAQTADDSGQQVQAAAQPGRSEQNNSVSSDLAQDHSEQIRPSEQGGLPPSSAETPSADFAFEDGKDYFSYTIPIRSSPIDGRIEVKLFFTYECQYCLTAFDNLTLYQRLHDEQIRLMLQPIATEDALFGPNVYYSLLNLDRQGLAELLLFDSADKQGKASLVEGENLYHWLIEHNIALDQFLMQIKSSAVADKAKEAVELTEKYGVFTSPFVVIDGQYVLTSSTLYNDDYTFAVMDFLISRILQQQQRKTTFVAESKLNLPVNSR